MTLRANKRSIQVEASNWEMRVDRREKKMLGRQVAARLGLTFFGVTGSVQWCSERDRQEGPEGPGSGSVCGAGS